MMIEQSGGRPGKRIKIKRSTLMLMSFGRSIVSSIRLPLVAQLPTAAAALARASLARSPAEAAEMKNN